MAERGREARSGPLAGLRVVEILSLGPGPFATMLLADLGADVLRIARPGAAVPEVFDRVTARGRRVIELDLKREAETALAFLDRADVLVEGFRPGVMERLGMGPETVLPRNPRLVYGRMTGWGQAGPLASAAGHDINYIALTGALAAIGPAGGPVPPLNLVGDYGGGALFLVAGVLAALWERGRSGRGQVVDCAMCDGVATLMSAFHALHGAGRWSTERAANFLDGGAPFYGTYECADGRHIALGAIEPQFWAEFTAATGLCDADPSDPAGWPALRARLAELFRQRTRAEWAALLEGRDACVSPVLTLDEAPDHPHMAARGSYLVRDGLTEPAPAPRFGRTPADVPAAPVRETVAEALGRWGAPAPGT